MTLDFDETTLRDFVGPGTSGDMLSAFRANQVEKRLLQLALLRRRAVRDAPELVASSGFEAAWDVLRSLPREVLGEVIWFPSFGRWAGVGQRFGEKDAYRLLPSGQVGAHLAHLGWFALAGALRAGITTALDVPADARGVIPLPSTRRYLDGGLERAGKTAHVEVDAGVATSDGFVLRQVRLLENGIELNDHDPYLAYTSDNQRFERLSPESADRWERVVRDALNRLDSLVPEYAREVRSETVALVPLECVEDKLNISSSSSDAYGMLQVSFHPDPEVIAETLVHEYHHTKLNALLDVVQFVDDPVGATDLYSPWRDDQRPAVGLLHGIWAFHSVVRYWHAAARQGGRATYEYARRRAQTLLAIQGLRPTARLTPEGLRLVDAVENALASLADVPPAAAHARRVADEMEGHRLRWRVNHPPTPPTLADRLLAEWTAAGGTTRSGAPVDRLVPENDAEAAAATRLGIGGGVHVNHPALGRVSLDPALNALGQLKVRDPEAFASLCAELDAVEPKGPLGLLLSAHADYVRGEFARARVGYSACLRVEPANFDVWRAFAFASRHLGDYEASEGFLFHAAVVLTLAARIDPDPGLLARLSERDADDPFVNLLYWVRVRASHD